MLKRIPQHYKIVGGLTLAALSIIGILLFRSYLEAVSLLRDQFAGQQMLTIRQTARGIEGSLGQLIREAEILSRRPAIRRLDLVESLKLMGQAFEEVKSFHVNDISRSDAEGVIRLTLNSPNLVGQDFSFREYFKEVRRRKESVPAFEFLTFRGFRKGEKGILVSMPVFGEKGEFAGPVTFVVEVGNLLAEFLPPEGGGRRTWVLDNDGTVLLPSRIRTRDFLHRPFRTGKPFQKVPREVDSRRKCPGPLSLPRRIKDARNFPPDYAWRQDLDDHRRDGRRGDSWSPRKLQYLVPPRHVDGGTGGLPRRPRAGRQSSTGAKQGHPE